MPCKKKTKKKPGNTGQDRKGVQLDGNESDTSSVSTGTYKDCKDEYSNDLEYNTDYRPMMYDDDNEMDNLDKCLNNMSIDDGALSGKYADHQNMDLKAELNSLLEGFTEKRSKDRLAALKEFPIFLSCCYGCEDIFSNQTETVLITLCQFFKRGATNEEKIPALTSLMVFIVFLSSNDDLVDLELFGESLFDQLFRCISNNELHEDLRVGVCRLLALACILGMVNKRHDLFTGLMEQLEALFMTRRLGGAIEQLQSVAMMCWAVCMPQFLHFDHARGNKSMAIFLSLAESLLNSNYSAISFMTGQVLALVAELTREDDRTDFIVSTKLIDTVTELIIESSKRFSKKMLHSQRSHFRNIERSLKGSSYDCYNVKLGRHVLEISKWKMHFHYEFISKILVPKFSQHLDYNSCLQEIFDCEGYVIGTGKIHYGDGVNKQIVKERNRAIGKKRDNKWKAMTLDNEGI